MTPTTEPATGPAPRTTNRLMLLLIAGMFVLPIVIAWLLASGRVDWQPATLTNHGTLIAPADRPLDAADQRGQRPAACAARADWALLYVSDQPCDAACLAVLRELGAMRMVIGKNGTRLSVFGVFAEQQTESEVRQIVDPALVRGIADRLRGDQPALTLPFIGFLDWRGQLMMHFAPSAPRIT